MIASKPMASQRAKPRRVNWKSRGSLVGLRLTAISKPAKTIPIPAPAPTTPMVAKPAPKNLAPPVILRKKIDFMIKKKRKQKEKTMHGKLELSSKNVLKEKLA